MIVYYKVTILENIISLSTNHVSTSLVLLQI